MGGCYIEILPIARFTMMTDIIFAHTGKFHILENKIQSKGAAHSVLIVIQYCYCPMVIELNIYHDMDLRPYRPALPHI